METTGRTRLSAGISETRENKKIAASKDWKNIRAPAKKKFPMLKKDNIWSGLLEMTAHVQIETTHCTMDYPIISRHARQHMRIFSYFDLE